MGAPPVSWSRRPPSAGYAELAGAVSRYADAAPPTVTEVRRAVAAFVREHPVTTGALWAMRLEIERCVREHAPPQLGAQERETLANVLVRWASDASAEQRTIPPLVGKWGNPRPLDQR